MNRLFLLMVITLAAFLVAGCESMVSSTAFTGTWNGTWTQTAPDGTKAVDSGTLTVKVSDIGDISGTIRSGLNGEGTVTGSIDDDRQLLLIMSYPSGSKVYVYRAEGTISASSPREIDALLKMAQVSPPSAEQWSFKLNVAKEVQ